MKGISPMKHPVTASPAADHKAGLESGEKIVRIGCGAGFATDRIDPAVDLANRGQLDYLFFEGLAERTLAHSYLARQQNPAAGFNPTLERRIAAVLPGCHENGTRILTNMGAANPEAAGHAIAALARKLGIHGLTIAVVEGDNITSTLRPEMRLLESGELLSTISSRIVAANAYLGADPIIEALETGADIVITGRVADPSLVVAPLVHAFGWARDDWNRLGAGTLIGHLLECSCQVTGGYFADPGYKDVKNLAYVGYPLAEVSEDGSAVITKLPQTGGCVTPLTVREQMLYEVHDPGAYLTPDVSADFRRVRIEEVAPDRIRVAGALGQQRPAQLKATIGFDGGFLAETEISYAGPGAMMRAHLAKAVLEERMLNLHHCQYAIRYDFIGLNALHGTAGISGPEPLDIRLRAAMRSTDQDMCRTLLEEMEALWIAGPAGGGGVRGQIRPSITTQSVLIDRSLIKPVIKVIEA
jgi:hypothetical protein